MRRRTANVASIKINEQLHARRRLLRLHEPKVRVSGKAIAMPKEVPPPSLPLQDGSEARELDNDVRQLVDRAGLATFFKIHAALACLERTAYFRIFAGLPCPWQW